MVGGEGKGRVARKECRWGDYLNSEKRKKRLSRTAGDQREPPTRK